MSDTESDAASDDSYTTMSSFFGLLCCSDCCTCDCEGCAKEDYPCCGICFCYDKSDESEEEETLEW